MNNLKIVFFILFFHSTFICADVIPDNKKRISYSFEITNINSYPDYTFIAYPVNQSNGVPYLTADILNPEIPLHLSCKFGAPVIYAVKKESFNRSLFDSLNNIRDNKQRDALLQSFFENKQFIPSIKIYCSSFVDKDEKYEMIQENFSIEEIKSDTMLIKSQKLLYKDMNNNVLDAKDSKMKAKEDLVTPEKKFSGYLFIIIPVLALVSIVSVILIRKMKK